MINFVSLVQLHDFRKLNPRLLYLFVCFVLKSQTATVDEVREEWQIQREEQEGEGSQPTVTASEKPSLPPERKQGLAVLNRLAFGCSHSYLICTSEPSAEGSGLPGLEQFPPGACFLSNSLCISSAEVERCETNCYSSFYNFRAFELNVLAPCLLSSWRGQRGLGSAVWAFLGLRWQRKSMTPDHLVAKEAPYTGRLRIKL